MVKNKKDVFYLTAIFSLTVAFAFLLNYDVLPNLGNNIMTGVNYDANVCVTHTNAEGEIVSNQCSHNVLYDTGAEFIEQLLGNETASDAADVIVLCNASAAASCETPNAGKTESFTNMTSCGLVATTGAYSSNGNGNWSISKTFTSSCDSVITNVTRLKTNSSNTDLAGNNFTLVSLESSDQITINWTIGVT